MRERLLKTNNREHLKYFPYDEMWVQNKGVENCAEKQRLGKKMSMAFEGVEAYSSPYISKNVPRGFKFFTDKFVKDIAATAASGKSR